VITGTDGTNAAGGAVPLDREQAIVGGVPDWAALAPVNVSHAVLTWLVALLVLSVTGARLLARPETSERHDSSARGKH